MVTITAQKIKKPLYSVIFVFLVFQTFFLILIFSSKTSKPKPTTFARGSKKKFSHIEFIVKISSKSITKAVSFAVFLRYFG